MLQAGRRARNYRRVVSGTVDTQRRTNVVLRQAQLLFEVLSPASDPARAA